jgi:plasmid maintenance system antidote protein VapI
MAKKPNIALKIRIIEKYGSQADFAPEAEISEPRLSRIVNGRESPKPEQAERIARALGSTVEELFS